MFPIASSPVRFGCDANYHLRSHRLLTHCRIHTKKTESLTTENQINLKIDHCCRSWRMQQLLWKSIRKKLKLCSNDGWIVNAKYGWGGTTLEVSVAHPDCPIVSGDVWQYDETDVGCKRQFNLNDYSVSGKVSAWTLLYISRGKCCERLPQSRNFKEL